MTDPTVPDDGTAPGSHSVGSRCRLDVVRAGAGDEPLVILIGGWNAPFVYQPLIERLPERVAVTVVALLPDRDEDVSPIISAIGARSTYIVDLLETSDVDLTGRPLALLGYSRAGHVAHEVASSLADAGCDVRLHVLVDTVFTGEEIRRPELVVAARRRKYRALAESRQYHLIAKELGMKAVERVRRRSLHLGAALVRKAGGEMRDPTEPEIVPLTEADYLPGPVDHAVLLYRASTSEPERTTDRWREVVPQLEEVVVEGTHGGEESVLGRDRVDLLAGDLTARLLSFADG